MDGMGEIPITSRRGFLKMAGGAAALSSVPAIGAVNMTPESTVKVFYESLTPDQRRVMCYDWNYESEKYGLVRSFVANNWRVSPAIINSDFYTADQRAMVRDIFEGLIAPEWHKRVDKQLEDDLGGFGERQAVAVFGTPGNGPYEFVLSSRHMTLRCDGDSVDHLAFGGPIFYGHQGQSFREKPDHPGNVYWPQALAANLVYDMLDGKQREQALVKTDLPAENSIAFRGKEGVFPGLPVSAMAEGQKAELQKVLYVLLEPFRKKDQAEALVCLRKQGGLDACSLAFYKQRDIGDDGIWDNWVLEGPSFVWNFRGSPHVHVWVNIASDASIKTNAG